MGEFKITNASGFHLTFDNGYTVSTQFGYGSYSENYTNNKAVNNPKSNNCEVAIFRGTSESWDTKIFFYKIGIKLSDDVGLQVDMVTWLKIIEIVKNEPKEA